MGKHPLVVVYNDKMLEMNKTSNINLKRLYECQGTILTIGDGDFSFSTAIATQFRLKTSDGTSKLIATSYDSLQDLNSKYPISAPASIETLHQMGVHVLHRVDARRLYESLEISRYRASLRPGYIPPPKYVANCGRIIFNFPHVGGTNVAENQQLLSDFFVSCFPLLMRPSPKNNFQAGEIHVALRNSPFYLSWKIEDIAVKYGYMLIEKGRFHTADYPGYQEQRTNPGVMRALPPASEGSTIYRFCIDPKYMKQLEKNGFFTIQPVDFSQVKVKTKDDSTTQPTEAPKEDPSTAATEKIELATPRTVVVKNVKSIGAQPSKRSQVEKNDTDDIDDDNNDDDNESDSDMDYLLDITLDQIRYESTKKIQPHQITDLELSETVADPSALPLIHQIDVTRQMVYIPISHSITLNKPTRLSALAPQTRAYRSTMAEQRKLLSRFNVDDKVYSDDAIANGVLVIRPFPIQIPSSAIVLTDEQVQEENDDNDNDDNNDDASVDDDNTDDNDSHNDDQLLEENSDSDYDIYTLADHDAIIRDKKRQQKRVYKHRKRQAKKQQRITLDPTQITSFIGYIIGVLPPQDGSTTGATKRKAKKNQQVELSPDSTETPTSSMHGNKRKNANVQDDSQDEILSGYKSFAKKKQRPNTHKKGIDRDELKNLVVVSDGYEYQVSEKERQSLIKYKAHQQKRRELEVLNEKLREKNIREKEQRAQRRLEEQTITTLNGKIKKKQMPKKIRKLVEQKKKATARERSRKY